ncbi:hypothetical protein FOL47_007153 [Perkinsus chesapeaki]|uniref:Uncharacterized protein n=1 Tax=Perkinsus chesapeaki TaxID=330153 RepID=A0A7J6LMH4_PERCH|nr:hypothetical protein FOL47_007153 [Perkinsus chesapeaki]
MTLRLGIFGTLLPIAQSFAAVEVADQCHDYCREIFGVDSYCRYHNQQYYCRGGLPSSYPCVPRVDCAVEGSGASDPVTAPVKSSVQEEPVDARVQAADGLTGCDSYCRELNPGVVTYCKLSMDPPTCKHGGQLCRPSQECTTGYYNPSASASSETRPKTTRNVIRTTSAPNNGANPRPGCEGDAPDGEEDVFWWTEWPSGLYTEAQWTQYYQRLFRLLTTNCAYMRVTKLILRVLHPQFPPGASSSGKLWYPDGDVTQSIIYKELLTKLGQTSVREIYMLPYVFDSVSREGWLSIAPTKGKVMSGVFHLLEEYNTQLSSIKFSGITVDYEEMKHLPAEYDLFWDPNGASDFKDGTNFEVGVAIGFDQIGRFEEWPWIDNFYLEMYDFFRPTPYIDQTSDSRFLVYENDYSKMVDYIVNEAVDKKVQAAHRRCHDRGTLALYLLGSALILDELKRLIWWMAKPYLPTSVKAIGLTELPDFESDGSMLRCHNILGGGPGRLLFVHAREGEVPPETLYVTSASITELYKSSRRNASGCTLLNREIFPLVFCRIEDTLYTAALGSTEILSFSLSACDLVASFQLVDFPVGELISSGGYLFVLKHNDQDLRVLSKSLSCCYQEARFRQPVMSIDVSASMERLAETRVAYVFWSDKTYTDGILRISSLGTIDEDEVAIDMPRIEKCHFIPNCDDYIILTLRQTHCVNLRSTFSDYDIVIFDLENLYCVSSYKVDYMRTSWLVDIKVTEEWYILLVSEKRNGSRRGTVLALES